MTTKMTVRATTVQKYYDALKELKIILDAKGIVTLSSLQFKHGLKSYFVSEIVRGGIIKITGKQGKRTIYTWNTIEPNLQMARQLIINCNQKTFEHNTLKSVKISEKEEENTPLVSLPSTTMSLEFPKSDSYAEAVKSLISSYRTAKIPIENAEEKPIDVNVLEHKGCFKTTTTTTTNTSLYFGVFKITKICVIEIKTNL